MKKKVFTILILSLFSAALFSQTPKNLNIIERMVVSNLLPNRASFTTWKIVNELRTELAPTEDELKTLNIRPATDGNGVTGNWDKVPEKEIVFGDMALKIIKEALQELDKKGELTENQISVYEKFVVNEVDK